MTEGDGWRAARGEPAHAPRHACALRQAREAASVLLRGSGAKTVTKLVSAERSGRAVRASQYMRFNVFKRVSAQTLCSRAI